jgi:hypothetical protein
LSKGGIWKGVDHSVSRGFPVTPAALVVVAAFMALRVFVAAALVFLLVIVPIRCTAFQVSMDRLRGDVETAGWSLEEGMRRLLALGAHT